MNYIFLGAKVELGIKMFIVRKKPTLYLIMSFIILILLLSIMNGSLYKSMEELFRTMKSQRHDFGNHVQTLYRMLVTYVS